MAAIMIIKVKGLIKRILEDLTKDKVAAEICEGVNGYNGVKKTDLGLLIF